MQESRCPLSQTRAMGQPRTPCPAHRASIPFPSKPDPERRPPCRGPRVGFQEAHVVLSCRPVRPPLSVSGALGRSRRHRKLGEDMAGKPHRSPFARRLAIWPSHLAVAVCLQGWHRRDELAGTRGPAHGAPSLKTWHTARPRGVAEISHPPGSWGQETKKSQPRGCVVLSVGRAQQPVVGIHRWTDNSHGSLHGRKKTDPEQERSSDTGCPGEGP